MSDSVTFTSRETAGRALGEALTPWMDAHPVVMGVPPGGMLVAREVAVRLHAPLDVLPVREITVPFKTGMVMGAAAPEATLLDTGVVRESGLRRRVVDLMMCRAMVNVGQMELRYRGRRRELLLTGKTVIVVMDGIITSTMARLALMSVRRRRAISVILAVPVATSGALAALKGLADHVVSLSEPESLSSVSAAYATFPDVDDGEVRESLDAVNSEIAAAAGAAFASSS